MRTDKNAIVNYMKKIISQGDVVYSPDIIDYIQITFKVTRSSACRILTQLTKEGRIIRTPARTYKLPE